jgi:hypothetical protein
MTPAEYQAGIERIAGARAALLEYEELALELAAAAPGSGDRSILLCVKEQIRATRLLVLEVGYRCGKVEQVKRGGWGG